MLNAISNNPEKFDYLKYFCDIILNDSNVTVSELDGVLNLIDSLLYKISAENINSALAIREKMNDLKESCVSKITVPQINIDAELNELEKGKLSLAKIIKEGIPDMELLKLRIEKISGLLSEEDLPAEVHNRLIASLKESSAVYAAQQILEGVDNSLNKAYNLAKKDMLENHEILVARNQVSTANTMLSQIWTSTVPDYILKRAEICQKKIAEIDNKLSIHASKEAMEKYRNLAEKVDDIKRYVDNTSVSEYASWKSGRLTNNLENLQNYLLELQNLRVYDDENQKKVRELVKDISSLIQKISDKRYKAYNKWAIDKIENARRSRDETSTWKAYTNEQASRDFQDWLMDIDRGLLTHDIGSCYDDVFKKIFYDQIPDKWKAQHQYKKATFEKIGKLEDF